MKALHVLVLAAVSAGAATALWLSSDKDTAHTPSEQKLYPTLAANPDSISRLTLSDATGAKVTIERKDGAWVIKEKHKYPANVSRVGELILSLAEARQVEQKTANPELYSRLALRDVTEAESAAVSLNLATSGGELALLVGNSTDRFNGSTFVRKQDSATSYLVAPAINVDTDLVGWLDTRVFDIADDEIQSVKVVRDGETLGEINKTAMFDAPFDLVAREQNEVLNDVAVRNLSQALTGLEFENVIRGVAFAWNDYKKLQVTYTLFSGVVIDVTLFYKEAVDESEAATDGPPRVSRYWLSAKARLDEALAQQFVPQPSSDGGVNLKKLSLTSADIADRRAEAESISNTRKKWIYEISSAQFQRMNQSRETLVNAQ